MDRLAEVKVDPIFIIGDHRSGTTLLYQLLDASKCFNVVTAYHLIHYHELLYNHFQGKELLAKESLHRRFAAAGLTDRLIDGVRVTPELPEEYGFRLKASGPRPQVRRETVTPLVELFRKVQLITVPERPLLLKNPWDALGFVRVKQLFPAARFVFIHRHPVCVISSQLKALRSLFAEKNGYVALIDPWYEQIFNRPIQLAVIRLLSGKRFGIGLATTMRHVTKVASYYLRNIDVLSPEEYAVIRYEDLCEAPDVTIGNLLSFLQAQPSSSGDYASYIRSRSTSLLPEVIAREQRVLKRLAIYCDRFGYQRTQVLVG